MILWQSRKGTYHDNIEERTLPNRRIRIEYKEMHIHDVSIYSLGLMLLGFAATGSPPAALISSRKKYDCVEQRRRVVCSCCCYQPRIIVMEEDEEKDG